MGSQNFSTVSECQWGVYGKFPAAAGTSIVCVALHQILTNSIILMKRWTEMYFDLSIFNWKRTLFQLLPHLILENSKCSKLSCFYDVPNHFFSAFQCDSIRDSHFAKRRMNGWKIWITFLGLPKMWMAWTIRFMLTS